MSNHSCATSPALTKRTFSPCCVNYKLPHRRVEVRDEEHKLPICPARWYVLALILLGWKCDNLPGDISQRPLALVSKLHYCSVK